MILWLYLLSTWHTGKIQLQRKFCYFCPLKFQSKKNEEYGDIISQQIEYQNFDF